MKIGVHLSSFTKDWQEPLVPCIRKAGELKFDGVEIPLPDPFCTKTREIKKVLKEQNLLCTCGTGLNLKADISSPDRAVREHGIRHIRKCLEICSELESDTLSGVLNAPWGWTAARDKIQDRIQYSKEILHTLAEDAKKLGVVLALEILNRYEGSMFNTVVEAKAFVSDIGHPNVMLHFDTFHAHIEEDDMEQAVRDGKGLIRHVHIGDNQRAYPGSGQIDFRKVIRVLGDIGYDRWLTLENFVRAGGEVAEGTFTWRDTDTNREHTVRQGLSYLREITEEMRSARWKN